MPDVDRSDTFGNPETQVADLKRKIVELELEGRTATPERHYAIGWWIHGARKHIFRLASAAAAQREGLHAFMIHESDGDEIWGLCSGGARIPGILHEDYTLETFRTLPSHVKAEGP